VGLLVAKNHLGFAEAIGDFSKLYDENQRLIRSLVFRLSGDQDLDDLVQEVFIKIWKKRYSFNGQSKLSTWIAAIAVNTAKDYLKKRNWRIQFADSPPQQEPSVQSESHILLKDQIHQALGRLDFLDRTLIVLQVMQGFTITETARVLKMKEGSVKSKTHHAKKHLAQILSEMGVHYESV
jgi:RNA polymerase sigma-70 factor (ECF subfamily)